MKSNIKVRMCLGLAGLLLAVVVQAQPYTRPQAISQDGRFMPAFGNEALVRARYTVKADGSTDDVEILGGFSNPFLEPMLKQTIEKWTFTPGTNNGEPIAYFNQEWTFALRVDPNAPPMPMPGPGGRRSAPPAPACAEGEACTAPDMSQAKPIALALTQDVKDGFELISGLITQQDFVTALKELKKLERRELHTVFDYTLVNDLRSTVLMAEKDMFGALEASKLATITAQTPAGELEYFLTDDILKFSLTKKFVLAASVRQYGLAYETYQALIDRFELPSDDSLHTQAATIKAALDAPDPLPTLVKIVDDSWTYTPSRRIFTVTDLQGNLKRINANCEHRNLELKYQAEVDWTLPESLGKCALEFVGKDDTQFTIYEFME